MILEKINNYLHKVFSIYRYINFGFDEDVIIKTCIILPSELSNETTRNEL